MKLQAVLPNGDKRDIDINLLGVFLSIYTHRSLTAAAKQLGITQPAISQALKNLRRQLGDELFLREANGVKPTQLSMDMVEDVRIGIQHLTSAVISTGTFDATTSRRKFYIAMSDLSEIRLHNQRFIERGLADTPDIRLRTIPIVREEIAVRLSGHTLDFAIDVPVHGEATLRSIPLVEIPMVCAVAPNHPLAKATFDNNNKLDEPLSMETYIQLKHALVSARERGGAEIDDALAAEGKSRTIALRSSHMIGVLEAVRQSDLAITCTSDVAAWAGLVPLKLPIELKPNIIKLYWDKTRDKDPAHRWMRELLINYYQPLTPKFSLGQ